MPNEDASTTIADGSNQADADQLTEAGVHGKSAAGSGRHGCVDQDRMHGRHQHSME
jgi:hypothetical protein